jgi:hypothetical protein
MNLSQSTDRIGMNAEDALRKAEMPDDCFWHQAAGQPVLRRFRNRVISGPFGELDRIAARPDALSKEAR